MVKRKKIELIIIVILVILYFVISIFISKFNVYRNTVFIGSSTKVEVSDGNIKIYNKDDEINKQDVKILFNDDFIDGYILTQPAESTDNGFSIVSYDNSGKMLLSESVLIAHTKDLSVNVKKTINNEIIILDEINEFLIKNNIKVNSVDELDYCNKVDIDTKESIYSLGLNISDDTYKSIVFMKKENEFFMLSSLEDKYTDIENKKLILGLQRLWRNKEKINFK